MTVETFYSYERRTGVRTVDWNEFYAICKGLALAVAPYQPDVIVGVAKGGLYAATLLAHFLRVDIVPVAVTRRVDDRVVADDPFWRIRPDAALIHGKRVLVVDEIAGSGKTVGLVRAEAQRLGAAQVQVALAFAHSWGTDAAEYIGLISDDFLCLPWGREIVQNGGFVMHPEYLHGLRAQGVQPGPEHLLGIAAVEAEKRMTIPQ
ncbi:MAG: hypothetical protein DWI57_04195 [Chloroflexi bacterium]|nr:MAG: hypothetical protein DWI57_04195 [Chloroflexota bacterium]